MPYVDYPYNVSSAPPSIVEGFSIGLQLCFSDAGECHPPAFSHVSNRVTGAGFFEPLRKDEKLDAVMSSSKSLLEMPLFVKKLLAMLVRIFTGDNVWASLIESSHAKTAAEERALVVARDEYRVRWHDAWEAEGLDFVLTAPHPMPAIPTGTAEKVTLISAALGMICNIVRTGSSLLPPCTTDPM
jgi:hypothetical protein